MVVSGFVCGAGAVGGICAAAGGVALDVCVDAGGVVLDGWESVVLGAVCCGSPGAVWCRMGRLGSAGGWFCGVCVVCAGVEAAGVVASGVLPKWGRPSPLVMMWALVTRLEGT